MKPKKPFRTKHINYLFPSVAFFLATHIFAQSTNSTNQKTQLRKELPIEFRPHMVDHFFEGCPSNSSCTQKTGKLYKQWIDQLKKPRKSKNYWQALNQFRKRKGLPLEVWSFPKAEKSEGLIQWDSPCQKHQAENKKILIALVMVKDFSEAKKIETSSRKLYLSRSYLLNDKKGITEYLVPRGIGPLYINGDSLIYTKDTEGVYYGLHLSSTGKIQLKSPKGPAHYPKTVTCPKKLVEHFPKHTPPENLYQGVYCQALWNQKTQKYQTMIFGWSCS